MYILEKYIYINLIYIEIYIYNTRGYTAAGMFNLKLMSFEFLVKTAGSSFLTFLIIFYIFLMPNQSFGVCVFDNFCSVLFVSRGIG